jgi:hypothetical protein
VPRPTVLLPDPGGIRSTKRRVAGDVLAGRDIRRNPDAWPAYRQLVRPLVLSQQVANKPTCIGSYRYVYLRMTMICDI